MTPRTFARACATLFLPMLAASPSAGVDINVTPTAVGHTPAIVGYNSGHFLPDSNTADWWRYSGVNGARVWSSPTTVEPDDDLAPWGDSVNSQARFLARRQSLRSDPLNPTYINWSYLEGRYQNNPTSGNRVNLSHAFGSLNDMGVDSLAVIQLTEGAHPFAAAGTSTGWADRWEYWQHFYAQAFYLARNFDVQRFHMYNEPDHSSHPDISQAEYLQRLQFASDAVQAAVADVNALFGKTLSPQVQAPVTAGGSNKFNPLPGGDPRDDTTGWGELVIENRHVNFLGQTDPNFNLIHTYAYQQYNQTGASAGNELATIKNLIDQTSGGEDIKIAVTEFNVHTAGTFATLAETLDTPSKSARFGAILANLANNQPDELYVFKFSQTDNQPDGSIKKNGTHFVDNDTAPYNIGGITKGGEVVRLFAKGFAGGHDLLTLPAASGSGASDLRLAASFNLDQNKYFLLSANEATAPRDLTVNIAQWGIEPGARIVIEEVSADRHGEVSQVIAAPASGLLNLTQSAQSVLLFSIPKNSAANYVTLGATDDAMVKAGANAAANYGDSPNLYAKNEPTNPAARNVSLIKFHTGSIVSSEVEQAILEVWGENAGAADQVIAHVYGVLDDQWNESSVNWNNAPNLADSSGVADDISHNFVEGIGSTAQFVGHLTGVAGSRTLSIDVTNFVRNHPDQEVTLLIAREVRFDGENVDDDLTSLRLASKERGGDPGPQLLLSLSPYALPGDYDANGIVDMADLTVWQANLGRSGEIADGNRDGKVAAADYNIWRDNLGNTLPGAQDATSSHAVPEPNVIVLVCLGIAPVAWIIFAP